MDPNCGTDTIKNQLRDGLEFFLNLCQEWDELVLVKSLYLVIKILELESEIEATVQNSTVLKNRCENEVEIKDGYAWKQFCKLNAHHCKLEAVLGEMAKFLSKVEQSCSYFEELVQKACQTHGTKRIFQMPLGLSWSAPQMTDELLSLSTQFAHSLQLHHALYDAIISPTTSMAEKQAALSYWACQPLLSDKSPLKDLLSIEFPSFISGLKTPRKSSQKKS